MNTDPDCIVYECPHGENPSQNVGDVYEGIHFLEKDVIVIIESEISRAV
jgi:hypothetical protein